MSIVLSEEAGGKILIVQLTGKIVREDYEHFVPRVEALVKQNGKLRIEVDMLDFHGWTLGAMWEDIKFDVKHFADIERLALVGNRKWESGMATFCKPFTTATVRYFDEADAAQARTWLREP